MSRSFRGPTQNVRVESDSHLTPLITVLRYKNIATQTPVKDTMRELIYKRKNNGRPPPDDELLVRITLTADELAKVKFDKLFPFDSFVLLDENHQSNSARYKRIYKEINSKLNLTGLSVFFISRYNYNTLSILMKKTSLGEGPSSRESSRESSGEGPRERSRESSGERQGERQGETRRGMTDRGGGKKKRSRKIRKYTKQKRYTKKNLF